MRPLFLIALLSLLPAFTFAATIHVPADYPTVLQGLDAAVSGDIVELAPGEYTDYETRPNIVYWSGNTTAMGFLKAGVTLRSSGGPEVTTLRMSAPAGGELTTALYFEEVGDAVVQGLTITGDTSDMYGLFCNNHPYEGGTLTLENCIVENLPAYGMQAYATGLTIRGCTFRNIVSEALYGSDLSLVVEDSAFDGCLTGVSSQAPTFTVVRCTFQDCEEFSIVGSEFESTCRVEECLFIDSGIAYVQGANADVTGCTFIRTKAFAGIWDVGEVSGNTFYGGEVVAPLLNVGTALGTPGPAVRNNIFAWGGSRDEAVLVPHHHQAIPSECNDFWSNAGGNANYALGPTDIVADPQFCDRITDDLHLYLSSPCLPANNPSCGRIGSMGYGCGPVSVQPQSWAKIKELYR